MLLEGGRFAVSFLRAEHVELARRFSAEVPEERFHELRVMETPQGLPILEEALAWTGCRVWERVEAGDHVILIGEVVDHDLGAEAPPLVFYGSEFGTFAELSKGLRVRLVHLSDLHLGFRAYFHLERGWNRRERDVASAFLAAVEQTARLQPDLVLITGDVFDGPNPPSTAFLTVHRALARLRRQLPDVPVLIIAGERDSPRSRADPGPVAVLDSLPGVEAAVGAPRAVHLQALDAHALLVPFRAAADPPLPEVRPNPLARWNLLLVRGRPSGSGKGVRVSPSEWNYVAVGGDHRPVAYRPNVRTAGAPERPGTCPWEEATEERGFLTFDLASGEAEFHPITGRPVVDLAPVRVTSEDPGAGTRRPS